MSDGSSIARVLDPVGGHGEHKGFSWMAIGAAIGTGLAIAACILFPPAGIIGAIAVGAGVISTGTAAAAIGAKLGKSRRTESGAPCSTIAKGSFKTRCEGQWIARLNDPNTHNASVIVSGAATVLEGSDGLPVARVGESATCGGMKILEGAERTIVGGESASSGKPVQLTEQTLLGWDIDQWIGGLEEVSTVTGYVSLGLGVAGAARAGAQVAAKKVGEGAATRAAYHAAYRESIRRSVPAGIEDAAERAAARAVARELGAKAAHQAARRVVAKEATKSVAKFGAFATARSEIEAGGIRKRLAGQNADGSQREGFLNEWNLVDGLGAGIAELGVWSREDSALVARGIFTVGPHAISTARTMRWARLWPKAGSEYPEWSWSKVAAEGRDAVTAFKGMRAARLMGDDAEAGRMLFDQIVLGGTKRLVNVGNVRVRDASVARAVCKSCSGAHGEEGAGRSSEQGVDRARRAAELRVAQDEIRRLRRHDPEAASLRFQSETHRLATEKAEAWAAAHGWDAQRQIGKRFRYVDDVEIGHIEAGEYGLPQKPGWSEVTIHGVVQAEGAPAKWFSVGRGKPSDVSAKVLADRMRADGYTGGPVRLNACVAGAGGEAALARQLSQELGAPVIAGTQLYYAANRPYLGDWGGRQAGRWLAFLPKSEAKANAPRRPDATRSAGPSMSAAGASGSTTPSASRAPTDAAHASTAVCKTCGAHDAHDEQARATEQGAAPLAASPSKPEPSFWQKIKASVGLTERQEPAESRARAPASTNAPAYPNGPIGARDPAEPPHAYVPNTRGGVSKIAPDHYAGGFHGTEYRAEDMPKILSEGVPSKVPPHQENWDLHAHTEGASNSAFRGATPVPATPDGGGAVAWAGKGHVVLEIDGVPTWDANAALEGRVQRGGLFRGNLMGGEHELSIPARVPPERIKRWGVVDELPDGRLVVRAWRDNPNYVPRASGRQGAQGSTAASHPDDGAHAAQSAPCHTCAGAKPTSERDPTP